MAAPSGLTRFTASLCVGPLPASRRGGGDNCNRTFCYFGVAFTSAFSITTLLTGISLRTGDVAILLTVSCDSLSHTLPNAVYLLSRNVASSWQMKNCVPAEFGSLERAIDR